MQLYHGSMVHRALYSSPALSLSLSLSFSGLPCVYVAGSGHVHARDCNCNWRAEACSLSLSLSLERARARWPSCHYPRPFAPAGTFSSISVRVIIAVSVPGDARICSTLRCSGMRHAILVDAYVATLNLDSSAPCLVEYVVGPLGHARHRF